MATIELNDDTLYTSALPAGARLFGATSAAASEPTSFGREAIYNYVSAALAPVASSGSATDLTSGTLPLGRLHSHLADISNILAPGTGDIIYFDGGNFVNLGIGEQGQVLQVSAGGIPEWVDSSASLGVTAFIETLLDDETASAARTTLGVVIGTNVQAWDAQLDSLSSASANGVSLVTAADYAAMRALLDLEAGTDFYSVSAANAAFQPLDSDLTSWAGVTRASGFDTFAAVPSLANLGALLTDEASGLITFMTTPSSANLKAAVTDETGSGALVFATSPTLITPALGVATGTSLALNGATIGSNALAVTGTSLFSSLLTVTQATANTGILASTGYSLTGSNATSMVDLAGTWNTSGTPTAIKLNITDTASNAASLLMDLQVGGTSKAQISKAGVLKVADGSESAPSITFAGSSNTGLYQTGNQLAFTRAGTLVGYFASNGYFVLVNGGITLNSAANINWGVGTFVVRDAANTLALRNSTSAQTFNWYYSYTDASNRQGGSLQTGSDYIEIAGLTAGTGADNLDVRLTPSGTGNVRFGSHSAIAAETVTGYITIKDSGGTTRKIAVVS